MFPFYAEPKEKLIEYDIRKDCRLNNQIKENYGALWIGYFETDINYLVGDDLRFVIDHFKIYAGKEGRTLLGEFKKDGVYDKEDKCFYRFTNLAKNMEVLGYSSEVLRYPLEIILVKKRNDSISEINPFGNIYIDFENNTLTEKRSIFEK